MTEVDFKIKRFCVCCNMTEMTSILDIGTRFLWLGKVISRCDGIAY